MPFALTRPMILGALTAAGILWSPGGVHAQTPSELARATYAVDPQHSSVAFTVRTLGLVKIRGRFLDYSGTIVYDPAHPERSSVTAVIQSKSITTDMDFRDNHLRSPDFFDVAAYPTIVFQSDRMERGPDGYRAIGRFTMRGVTRTIALPITIALQPESRGTSGTVNVAFETTMRLSRSEYGIAGTNKFNSSFNPLTSPIADSVDINLELMANRGGYRDRTFAGQTPPSIADTVQRTLATTGVAAAIRVYRDLHATKPGAFRFSAGHLDALGRQLMERGKLSDAIAILTLNEEMYPAVNGVTQSLAEAYMLAGDRDRAVAGYRRALQVDARNTMAIEMLRRLAPPTE